MSKPPVLFVIRCHRGDLLGRVLWLENRRVLQLDEAVVASDGIRATSGRYTRLDEAVVGLTAWCQSCRGEFPVDTAELATANADVTLDSLSFHADPMGVLDRRAEARRSTIVPDNSTDPA